MKKKTTKKTRERKTKKANETKPQIVAQVPETPKEELPPVRKGVSIPRPHLMQLKRIMARRVEKGWPAWKATRPGWEADLICDLIASEADRLNGT